MLYTTYPVSETPRRVNDGQRGLSRCLGALPARTSGNTLLEVGELLGCFRKFGAPSVLPLQLEPYYLGSRLGPLSADSASFTDIYPSLCRSGLCLVSSFFSLSVNKQQTGCHDDCTYRYVDSCRYSHILNSRLSWYHG